MKNLYFPFFFLLFVGQQKLIAQDITIKASETALPDCRDGAIYLRTNLSEQPLSWEYFGENGQTGAGNYYKISDLGTGNYSITVTNAHCESAILSIFVPKGGYFISFAQNDSYTSIFNPQTHSYQNVPDCKGKIELDHFETHNNPNNIYTFLWNDGNENQNRANLCGGETYSVTITEANGCTQVLDYDLGICGVNTYNSNPLELIDAVITPNTGNNNGAIDITLNANSGVNYWWIYEKGSGSPNINFANTEDISGLECGKYRLRAFDGCHTFEQVFTVPCDCSNVPPLNFTFDLINICENGQLSLDLKNYLYGPLTYKWSNSSGGASIGASQTITVPDREKGTYFVTVTNGCGQEFKRSIVVPCDCHYMEHFDPHFIPRDPCLKWGIFDQDGGLEFDKYFLITNNDYVNALAEMPVNKRKYDVLWIGNENGIKKSSYVLNTLNMGVNVLTNLSGSNWYNENDGAQGEDIVVVTVSDALGCAVSECYAFGDEIDISSFTTVPLNNVLPNFGGLGEIDVIANCETCKVCGGDCDGSGNGHNPACNDAEAASLVYLDTGAPNKPCKNGAIRCENNSDGIIEFEDALGIPFPFYNKLKVADDGSGNCIYECGCLFPAGQIPGMPHYAPVFVKSTIRASCAYASNNPTLVCQETENGFENAIPGNLDPINCSFDLICPNGQILQHISDDWKTCHLNNIPAEPSDSEDGYPVYDSFKRTCTISGEVQFFKIRSDNVNDRDINLSKFPNCSGGIALTGDIEGLSLLTTESSYLSTINPNKELILETPKSISTQSIFIYPNPTDGFMFLNLEKNDNNSDDDVEVTLLSLDGVIISKTFLSNNKSTDFLDLSKQNSGLYVVSVFDGKTRSFFKVTKIN